MYLSIPASISCAALPKAETRSPSGTATESSCSPELCPCLPLITKDHPVPSAPSTVKRVEAAEESMSQSITSIDVETCSVFFITTRPSEALNLKSMGLRVALRLLLMSSSIESKEADTLSSGTDNRTLCAMMRCQGLHRTRLTLMQRPCLHSIRSI